MVDEARVQRILAAHPSLVGRRAELERIAQELESAAAGTPSVLRLEGSTGMGKTTLLEAASTAARECGFQIGRATASPLEKEIPFAVVRQLFERMLSEQPAVVAVGVARHGHDVITGTFADTTGSFEEVHVHKAIQGVYRIAADLAQRAPLCLIIDDVQWTDVSSLRWLNYLVHRMTKLPIAVLVSRTSGIHSSDPLLLAELGIYSDRVKLEGLSRQDAARLAEQVLGHAPDDAFVAALRSATGGNPLVMCHLLAAVRRESASTDEAATSPLTRFGPEELGRAVLARLNRQSGELVRLARAIAVVAPGDLELAAAITDLELPEAADHVRQLEGMGFLASGNKLEFTHSIIRDAITNAARHTERDALHAKAARYLHETRAPSVLVARHVQRTASRLGVWAVEALRAAADTVIAEGDPRTGARFLARALREDLPDPIRRDLLLRLGSVESYFDPRVAVAHLEEGMSELEDPEMIFNAACRLAQVLYLDADYEKASAVLNQAVDMVGSRHPTIKDRLCLTLGVTVPSEIGQAEHSDLRQFIDENWRREDARSLNLAALSAEYASNRGENLPLAREAGLVAMSKGVAPIMEHPQRLLAVVNALIRADELERALRYCSEIVLEAHREGLSLIGLLGHVLRSRVHFHCGSLAEAVADARLGLAAARALSLPQHHLGSVYAVDAEVRPLLHLGEMDAARDAMSACGMSSALPNSWHHTVLLHARGALRMEDGDVEGALADQLQCGERLETWGIRNPACRPWRSYGALARFRLGQRQQALDLALEELRLAREWGAPTTIGRALLTVGIVTGGAAAVPWLTEARSVLGTSPSRLLRANVLQELGATRWKLGQHENARQHLAEAKALAEQCGAVSVLRKLAELPDDAVSLSVAIPPPQQGIQLSLTPHEYRVAMLVVAGNSNDEIAHKLHVSRRAIEFHLTNIYRKLGVRRRTQLSSALQALSG
ncbi:helix-turn-helix transcriptional regulator [Lentzea sp. E54]|uniref:helix-turn-helix transcriptional regulator n=1 Tax=Lentzea xerophila TaxID=3435883 RepID=UPI003DA22947